MIMLMSEYKSGFVALIGRPNVGKSTLMNHLVGQKIAITSPKPQTTRNRIRSVYTDERGQIVFMDTPGLHKSRNKLGDYMVEAARGTFNDADLILWLVEPDMKMGAGDVHILESLKSVDTPIILCINKCDTVSHDDILPVIAAFTENMEYAEVIPVSALKEKGLTDLLDTIYKYLPEGEPFYDEDTVTDQPMRQIAAEIIREKVLRSLNDEIPHGVAVTIEQMEFKKSIVNIDASIICEKDSHKGIIIGKHGAMLKKIGTDARRDIENMVEMQVNLKLWVKVRRDWRDSDIYLKNFGFDKKSMDI